MQFILAAKSHLKAGGMVVTEDWLKECVEFFCDQMKNRQTDIEELCSLVKSQWLLADLRDISPGCLPSNLNERVKTTLDGTYALQMNYIIDIGVPSYQQLQKMRKIDTTNVEATDIESSEQPSSSHRMLKLMLTDGVQEISGIEYKPMRNLNTHLMPGIKIQIKGPIDCRRGVLMLEEKHVTILGGEVDDLLERNNYKNILTRKIGQSTAFDGLSCTESTRDVIEMAPIVHVNAVKPTANPETHIQSNVLENFQEDFNLDAEMFDDIIDLDQLEAIENRMLKESNITNAGINTYNPLICIDEETRLSQSTQTIESYSNASRVIYPVKVDRNPFIYLKQLEDVSITIKNNTTFTVKGQILNVVGKLSFQKKDWVLKCTLIDGSASLDVNLNNDLLSIIIGYTPEEMMKIKKNISTEPNLKESLLENLNKAMDHIKKLDCLFHILYKEDVPYVVKTSSFTHNHLKQLHQRALKVKQPS